jgi:Anti-sigma-K factor rskA/Putative zinc-finger
MRTPPAPCADCRELIGGYILDALEPDEMEAVARHLEVCPECVAEHRRLELLPDLLDLAGIAEPAQVRPPEQLEEAVLDRFAREHPSERREKRPRRPLAPLARFGRQLRRPVPLAAGAALAAAAVTLAIVLPGGGQNGYTASPGDSFKASLTGLAPAPSAHAVARLQTVSSGTRVWLRVNGLKGQPQDLYELWCVRDDGTKISAGTFRVDSRGRAAVNLTTAAVMGDYHRLSVERKPQPPARATGQRVMAGEIQYGTS